MFVGLQFDLVFSRLKSQLRSEFEQMLLDLDSAAAASRTEAEARLSAAVDRVNAANEALERKEAHLATFRRDLAGFFKDLAE